MDVLVFLCSRANAVISTDELLEQCWETTLYGDNPVHKAIAQLRRVLGDNPVVPQYIETIRKRGYRAIAEVRWLSATTFVPPCFLQESPFRGLLPFDAAHEAVFFGRNEAIFKFRQLIGQQIRQPQAVALLMLLGPSGAGKTSLIQAGVLPSLAPAPAPKRIANLQQQPLQVLSQASFDLAEKGSLPLLSILATMLLKLNWRNGFPAQTAAQLALRLQSDFDALLPLLMAGCEPAQAAIPARHVLFIDRFEAVFDEKTVPEVERNAFILALDKLARTPCLLILLACRNDFYPQIAANPVLMECKLRGAHFDLLPPSHSEIAQMIRLPAQAANLVYEVNLQSGLGLDEVLCESANGNPDALPLLQYTLHELYRMRQGRELGFAAYEQLGGIEGAIGQRAEQLISSLSDACRACLPRVLSLVVTISKQQPEIRSRHASWAALRSDDERALVNALVNSRLFVSELAGGVSGFGVAHEALLRRWPRVQAWIDSHRIALQIRARLGHQAQRWEDEARNPDLLLPEGRQLEEARALVALATFSLSPLEQALIRTSGRRSRRRQSLHVAALAMMVLLSLLIALLGLSARKDQRQAQQQRMQGDALTGLMLGEFTEKLRPLGRLDLLDSIGARALDYFSKSSDQDLNQAALVQRARALQVLAEVRIERHDAAAASGALQASDAILRNLLAREPMMREALKTLGGNARLRGQMAMAQNDWLAAKRQFLLHLDCANRLHQLEPASRSWLVEQSNAQNDLGILAVNQRHYLEADGAFSESIRIRRAILALAPQDRALSAELGDSLAWSGLVKESLGEFQAAMALYQKEAEIVEALHREFPSESLWASRWALALQNQAQLNLALGDNAAALRISQRSEQINQKVLLQDPSNRARLLDMILIRMRTQRIAARSGDPLAQMQALDEIRQTTQKMVQSETTRRAWERVDAQLQLRIGVSLLNLRQLPQARQRIAQAQQRLEAMLGTTPANMLARLTLVESLLANAELETRSQNVDAARKHCARGAALIADFAKESFDYRILDPWVRLNWCLGHAELVQPAQQRLAHIGYQDSLYLQLVQKRDENGLPP